MSKTIIKAPGIIMKEMKSLFIEMTEQNCNLRCRHCYINFNEKKIKDFIPIETIKQNLILIDRNVTEYIHLTGGEPMMHPDFNNILRLCLKYANVVIHTNALNINDKKARFLKKVEDENNMEHEIIFMISIDHYLEKENDEIRGRGSYRKAVHALQSLVKYEFNPILAIVNHNNQPEDELKSKFKELCNSINFETADINYKIVPLLKKNEICDITENTVVENLKTECSQSRTLTVNGIFTCPLLSSDNRGKCGSNLNNFSRSSYLETGYCSQCAHHNKTMFSLEL